MLKDLIQFIQSNSSKDIIIAGNFNQSLYSKDIEDFLICNEFFKLYNLLNSNDLNQRDNTYIFRSKCIDFIAALRGVINHIEGCKLINYNQIIQSDHREYLFDINLKRYFKMSSFDIDRVNSS